MVFLLVFFTSSAAVNLHRVSTKPVLPIEPPLVAEHVPIADSWLFLGGESCRLLLRTGLKTNSAFPVRGTSSKETSAADRRGQMSVHPPPIVTNRVTVAKFARFW